MKYPITPEISSPETKPVTTDEAKAFFREDRSIEDALIDQFIGAARIELEAETGYVLIEQEFKMYLRGFEKVKIPKKPLKSDSVSIQYIDEAGAEATLPMSSYKVHEADSPAEVEFLDGLPSLGAEKYPVIITFTVGYGPSASDVPDNWKTAVSVAAMIIWMRDMEEAEVHPIQNPLVQSALKGFRIGRFK